MLSISAMGAGHGDYYLNLAREDYYLAGGEPPGRWLGRGGEALGLSGTQVERLHLENLLKGMAPGGERALVQQQHYRQGRSRQPGWDLTFSAPKSVSVLWSQAPPDVRRRIQAAHGQAVDEAVRYLESTAAFSRRGKSGRDLARVGLIGAAFEHGTSRAQDPQLHTHVLILNVGRRADGTFGTIRSRDLYQHQLAAGAVYRSELGRALSQELGLRLRKVQSWFELAAVPEALCDFFSKRRAQILEAMQESGQCGPRAAEFFALSTREVKGHVSREDLFEAWRRAGVEQGLDIAEVLRPQAALVNHTAQLRMVAAKSLGDVARSHSHFMQADVVRRALESTQHLGLGVGGVVDEVRQLMSDPARVVSLGTKRGQEHFTARENLDAELRLRSLAARSSEHRDHHVSDEVLFRILERHPTMNAEQRRALRFITQRLGSVNCVSGMAGTGKTFLLKAAREAWEVQGFKVIGASLAAIAALGLEEASGIPSRTIAKYFRDWESDESTTGLKQAVRYAARGVTYNRSPLGMWLEDRRARGRWALDSKTVLVVDEAGMVDTRTMDRLLRRAERAGSKVVLVGDQRQLQPIEAGGPFRAIIGWLGAATLDRVQRQRHQWMRRAVHQFARGDAEAGLSHYARRGFLELAPTKADAITALAHTWNENRTQDLRHSLMIAGTNAETQALNRMAQEMRANAGEIRPTKLALIGEERFLVGDRVVITENRYDLGIRNGDFATVETLERTPLSVWQGGLRACHHAVLRLDRHQYVARRGRPKDDVPVRVTVDLSTFEGMRLGYAVTAHKSQGVTVERIFTLAGGWMQDAELAYVQMSRAVSKCFIAAAESGVGEKLATLVREMGRSRAKDLAQEFAIEQGLGHEM